MLRNIQEWSVVLLIVGAIVILGNWMGFGVMPFEAIPGMLILVLICLIGLFIGKILPFNLPSMIYIAILGVLVSLPVTPGSEYIVQATDQIDMLAITTPVLAFAGIAIGRRWADFRKLGWRVIVVGFCVLSGTFLGSAIIAEIVLRIQGIV
ncbi:hypothetical protein HUG20_10805 [Salicibibacter cibi]|uniref:DUF340 domain-containing protein n=1 Tax=Salicibibacter cibi TaxID=2743001 RepID=A0A7T6ZBH1_9BACI|nr:hypothetical protein [Salicibibacter cibi]QQK80332.1 hypothetical protein HUG20_10805 [Salicibibacter cibi]